MGKVANCKNCEELTPVEEIKTSCITVSCQVCGNYIYTDVNNAIAEVDDKWLADFWRAKYFGKGAFGNNVVIIGHNSSVIAEHVAAHGPIGTTTVSKLAAHVFPEGKLMPHKLTSDEMYESYNPTINKSKFHK